MLKLNKYRLVKFLSPLPNSERWKIEVAVQILTRKIIILKRNLSSLSTQNTYLFVVILYCGSLKKHHCFDLRKDKIFLTKYFAGKIIIMRIAVICCCLLGIASALPVSTTESFLKKKKVLIINELSVSMLLGTHSHCNLSSPFYFKGSTDQFWQL